MCTMTSIFGIYGSRISGQDTVNFMVIDVFVRVLLDVVGVVLLLIPHANSLLLVSSNSSSASKATDVL
jgi:hypothetical protein